MATASLSEDDKSKPQVEDAFLSPANREFYENAGACYAPLDPSKQEIRLLQILDCSDGRPLSVELLPAALLSPNESPPRYCAISYCAGDPKETEELLVNGIPFNAFASLACALRRVSEVRDSTHLRGEPQLIWADQICINQSDAAERSHQVGFMRQIYQGADLVLAYLGSDPSNGRWVRAAHRLNVPSPVDKLSLNDRILYFGQDPFADFYANEFQRDWESISEVMRSPWWCRAWIHQEAVVARRIAVLFGHSLLDWQTLQIAIFGIITVTDLFVHQLQWKKNEIHGDATDRLLTTRCNSSAALYIINSRNNWRLGRGMGMLGLLTRAQLYLASDPRDRVFAFIGLADSSYGITPDYTLDASAVSILACRSIILHERRLDVLTYCVSNDGHTSRELPSWVRDWCEALGASKPCDFLYDAERDYPPFRASLDCQCTATISSLNVFAGCSLDVQCLFIDDLANEGMIRSPPEVNTGFKWDDWKSFSADLSDETAYPHSHDGSISYEDALIDLSFRGAYRYYPQYDDAEECLLLTATRSREVGKIFRSPKNYLGITKAVKDLRHTDYICVLLGANVPFILRRVEDHYVLISDAYVEGLMEGEAIEMMRRGEIEVQTIALH